MDGVEFVDPGSTELHLGMEHFKRVHLISNVSSNNGQNGMGDDADSGCLGEEEYHHNSGTGYTPRREDVAYLKKRVMAEFGVDPVETEADCEDRGRPERVPQDIHPDEDYQRGYYRRSPPEWTSHVPDIDRGLDRERKFTRYVEHYTN